MLRLISAMEQVFMEENGVSTSLVADVHQYVFKSSGNLYLIILPFCRPVPDQYYIFHAQVLWVSDRKL